MKNSYIPYGKQNITEEDISAVVEVLKSDFLTQGPKIKEFEENFARYVEAKYAIAVSNGTAALHLSVLALGLKEKQKVITTPISFAATANCIRYCGAEVVFADINPETYLLDFESVKSLVENNPIGTFKGIIPVDFAGRAVELEKYRELCDTYDLFLLEDACHAPGGYFVDKTKKNQLCGNGNYADAAIFSFHPVKHIAAGEGGMITTDDVNIYNSIIKLRTHGITKDETQLTANHGGWYYEMQELGFNYRITDFQAALGNSQLKRASSGLRKRKELVERYNKAFANVPGILRYPQNIDGHAFHLYVIEVNDRLGLYNYLRKNKVFAQVHYVPIHLMPYYKQFGWKDGDLPQAERYYSQCISLPMYPSLSDKEQDFVINSVKGFLNE